MKPEFWFSRKRSTGSENYPAVAFLFRLATKGALWGFYKSTEVVGAQNVPKNEPVLVVANHFNSLIDGAVLAAKFPRFPSFLAASSVMDSDVRTLAPILRAIGTIPVYRRQDGNSNKQPLSVAFGRAINLLASKGVLAIFPEGLSHNESRVLPLKTGAARIAIEAQTQNPELRIKVVPVCLSFEEKNRWRSRVLLEIGKPLDVSEYTSKHSGSQINLRDDTRRLTEDIKLAMSDLMPDFRNWGEASLLARFDEILNYSSGGDELSMAEVAKRRRNLRKGLDQIQDTHSDRINNVLAQLETYDALLLAGGINDRDVFELANNAPGKFVESLRTSLGLAWRIPFILTGLVFNYIPFRILFGYSRRQEMDKRSTYSILASIVGFPVYWVTTVIMAIYASSFSPSIPAWAAGLSTAVVAPMSGVFMLYYKDWKTRKLAALSARRVLLANEKLRNKIIQQRELVQEGLNEILVAQSKG